jgi:predicted transposase YbfD/YdcC
LALKGNQSGLQSELEA